MFLKNWYKIMFQEDKHKFKNKEKLIVIPKN